MSPESAAVYWLRRKIRGLLTRIRLVPPLALACLMIVGCSASSPPPAKTEQTARVAAVVAYESAAAALAWLDGQNAGQHEAMSNQVIELLKEERGSFLVQCGEAKVQECQLSAYDSIMREWRKESGYDERTARLERANNALSLLADVLQRKASDNDVRTVVRDVADSLSLIVGELESRKVDVPPVVYAGLAALRKL